MEGVGAKAPQGGSRCVLRKLWVSLAQTRPTAPAEPTL